MAVAADMALMDKKICVTPRSDSARICGVALHDVQIHRKS
jgi:hypothetical protein